MKTVKKARASAIGQPGKFACDRCGAKAPKGVYTGVAGHPHACPDCVFKLAVEAGFTGTRNHIGDALHFLLASQRAPKHRQI
jgi:hypothetical protein